MQTRDKFLPFALPDIGEQEIDEVVHTLRSGWITTGPKTKEFEQRIARYIGAEHTIAVNSCTGALHIALAAIGVERDDEVITSPLTFCSTANVIIHLGAMPIFADMGDDFNIDPAADRKAHHAAHQSHRAGALWRAALQDGRDHGLAPKSTTCTSIEDAAHAIGARYGGRMIGTIGDVTAFSFYAIKNMTTAEGGMITTRPRGAGRDDAHC